MILCGAMNPKMVGKTPQVIGEDSGIYVPEYARVLIAVGEGVGHMMIINTKDETIVRKFGLKNQFLVC